ncbi:SDR family NAD(P)-dependent oxidoreductase [Solirubrobacter taibaiensis]|nr:SDR family NAD(P)-dependent oxidoreductase [Solirubrobacter taibaiensis]
MARILITGSAGGLGQAAAEALQDEGHEVILHARSADRVDGSAVVGDLADVEQTRDVAHQVNELGRLDAVIHNAGVYTGAAIMPVNVVATYLLTALIDRPQRLVYLTSGMHNGGRADLNGIDWTGRQAGSYSDSKLFVTTLALAIARLWPDVSSNAVDPGWVPTRMGGPHAPDDLELGHVTQAWLATSDEPEALSSGGFWYHQQRRDPPAATGDPRFQDELLSALADYTGTPLPR